MTTLMDKGLARVGTWPTKRQDEAAELLQALDKMGPEAIDVDDEARAAIDEG